MNIGTINLIFAIGVLCLIGFSVNTCMSSVTETNINRQKEETKQLCIKTPNTCDIKNLK